MWCFSPLIRSWEETSNNVSTSAWWSLVGTCDDAWPYMDTLYHTLPRFTCHDILQYDVLWYGYRGSSWDFWYIRKKPLRMYVSFSTPCKEKNMHIIHIMLTTSKCIWICFFQLEKKTPSFSLVQQRYDISTPKSLAQPFQACLPWAQCEPYGKGHRDDDDSGPTCKNTLKHSSSHRWEKLRTCRCWRCMGCQRYSQRCRNCCNMGLPKSGETSWKWVGAVDCGLPVKYKYSIEGYYFMGGGFGPK